MEKNRRCGQYDLEVVFAERLGWRPWEVAQLEVLFAEEMMAYWEARDIVSKDK